MAGHRAPSLHGDTQSDRANRTDQNGGLARTPNRTLLALGVALSDGRMQIVALAGGQPPRIAGMVTIDEFSSDIRLELQLNELLQSLPGDMADVPIGVGFQPTTEHDKRNLQWATKAMLRLETNVECTTPLAECIAHVQLGGNPHPLLHGAIGAALLALERVIPGSASADEAEAANESSESVANATGEPPAGAVVSTKLIERLLSRVDELEETIRNTGPVAVTPGALSEEKAPEPRPLAPQDALDQHIEQLADEPAPADDPSPAAEIGPVEVEVPEPDGEFAHGQQLEQPATEQLERQLASERSAARDAALQLERLAGQLDARLAEASEHSDQVRRLNATIDETKTHLRTESRLAHDQRIRMADLEAEIVRLGESLSTARDERRRTEQRFAVVAARNEKLEAQADVLAESQVEVYRLNARISILEDKLDNERRRTRSAQERASRLRHDIVTGTTRPLQEPRNRASKRVG